MSVSKIEFTSEGIRESTFRDWLLRFIFGGVVSAAIYLITKKFGPVIGGVFLGFPSILPATVMLVKKQEGRAAAAHCVLGAIYGSTGMIVFAVLVAALVDKHGFLVAVLAAVLGWLAVSYLVWRTIHDKISN